MSPSNRHSAPPRRQGIILLIVVILLALFAVVGLSFMLYAESEATASRIYKEGQAVSDKNVATVSARLLLNYAMSQLIFDCRDDMSANGSDQSSLFSALRGHSLARNMYGWNYQFGTGTDINPASNQNFTPFNGLGPIRTNTYTFGAATLSDYDLPNYTYFKRLDPTFVRDPERIGFRNAATSALTQYAGGANVPYTYPDRTSMFLAGIVANDPQLNAPKVKFPSFYRPGTPFDGWDQETKPYGSGNSWANANNPWLDSTKPYLKYMTLRPRPADHYFAMDANGNVDPRSFPPPEDAGGDVKNLPGVHGFNFQNGRSETNDSYWMDLGYPVQITSQGTKFKPLFAFLIVDLDNKLNLNTHGNIQADGPNNTRRHASSQGLGRHEVDLSVVFPQNNTGITEYMQLFRGAAGTPFQIGRFGKDTKNSAQNVPGNPTDAYTDNGRANNAFRPYLMRLDYDCLDNSAPSPRTLSTRFTFQSGAASFPTYGSSFDNLQAGFALNPQQWNPFLNNSLRARQLGDFAFQEWKDLYYLYGTSGTLYNRADVARLIPNTLASPRTRHLLTTLSMDLETPGVTPWTDLSQTNSVYKMEDTDRFPGASTSNPTTNFTLPAANTIGTQPPGSEFLANNASASPPKLGAGRAAVYGRLDLNRKLAPFHDPASGQMYPTPPSAPPTGTPRPYPAPYQFWEAYLQRQEFAAEIWERLVRATGANPTYAGATPQQQNALRYLAQLAANIVDYVDEDDIMTPFSAWSGGTEFVFGTELPKVVLNEVYAQIRNKPGEDMAPPGASSGFQFDFWIELLNPLPKSGVNDPNITGATADRASAVLQRVGQPHGSHRILIARQALPAGGDPMRSNPKNTTGDPSMATGLQLKLDVSVFAGTGLTGAEAGLVRPDNGNPGPAGGNTTFYVLGPNTEPEPMGQTIPTTVKINPTTGYSGQPCDLSYASNDFGNNPPDVNTDRTTHHTILLQRLANPWLPPNPATGSGTLDPNLPPNPYITVDYAADVKARDGIKYGPMALPGDPPRPAAGSLTNKYSYGRRQPYAAAVEPLLNTPAHFGFRQGPRADMSVEHTFFQHNTGAQPFNWLVHLDRAPISVAELLHVSGYKPHELTQQFVVPSSTTAGSFTHYAHMAPWAPFQKQFGNDFAGVYDQATVNKARIFRALESFTVSDRTNRAFGGRVPGKINLNTVWDPDTLVALANPQQTGSSGNNYFTMAEVYNNGNPSDPNTLWGKMSARRNTSNRPLSGSPAVSDMNADPAYPETNGVGVQDTMWGGTFVPTNLSAPGAPTAPPNPYAFFEALTKIHGNTTTRSNTFAVFLTVGFFEVVDDTALPVKLGAEIKNKSGQPNRRRMFAIVDRTNLALDHPTGPTDTTAALRQADGTKIRPAALTSETSIVPVTGQTSYAVTIAGGNPALHADGEPLRTRSATSYAIQNWPTGPTGLVNGVVYVDVGDRQEQATVTTVTTLPNGDYQATLVFSAAPKWHAAGFTITNVILGNPGPQGEITEDLTVPSNKYKYLVPFAQILE